MSLYIATDLLSSAPPPSSTDWVQTGTLSESQPISLSSDLSLSLSHNLSTASPDSLPRVAFQRYNGRIPGLKGSKLETELSTTFPANVYTSATTPNGEVYRRN